MSYVICSDLAYAHPGGDPLFSNVSFRVTAGRKVGVVGANGIGKSTLFGVLSGALTPEEGDVSVGGRVAHMRQDVGAGGEARSVRAMLLDLAPGPLRSTGERMAAAEQRLAAGDDAAGMHLAAAIADWSELGGYELQGQWDASCRRIARSGFAELADRPATTLSGGERKRLVLDVLFASDADVLLLDEPDNFLDVASKRALEQQIATSKKTVIVISHDRELLSAAVSWILTVEGDGAWMHAGSYATYPQAREQRQRKLGDAVTRWKQEERRLFARMKTFKERALLQRLGQEGRRRRDALAAFRRHGAAASTGRRPADPGADAWRRLRPQGAGARRRRRRRTRAALQREFHFGERLSLIGPNGGGETQLMRAFAGERALHSGEIRVGNRVSIGSFTQFNARRLHRCAGRSARAIQTGAATCSPSAFAAVAMRWS